ncbi:MAG: MFS transporter [Candidatus Aminicenantes bacterium]|nr:MFS transporter [Candidatus Aminicenantes bacterium]MDH5385891.1 MFS transporter [Candidatus Aminicenantes bacterium]MDH5742071.1 MFS transporter [Candidatus Aminicenantes bacterium]
MKKMTAVVALMAVFTLAVCFIILGAISVELMDSLGIDEGQFGTLAMGLFLTSCIVQLIIGPLVDKLGYKPIAILGFVVTSASVFLLAFASNFGLALISCILLGIGAMSLNTVGNTLIPIVLFEGKDPARASNFGNAFFGLGYVLTPFLFVFFLSNLNLSYSTSLSIIGVLVLVFLVFALTASYPQVSTGYKFSMAIRLLGKGAVLLAALALFCYISLEVSMGTWIRKLMEQLFEGNANPKAAYNAGLVLSAFGLAMMAGRFFTSTIKNLTAIGNKVIPVMALVSLGAVVLMIIANSPAVAIFAIFLAGLAFAPIFPTIVGVTFAKFDSSLYGSIFGIIFAVGLLGGTFVPKFIGNLSVGSTVQQSLWIAAAMAAILFVVALIMGITGKQKE